MTSRAGTTFPAPEPEHEMVHTISWKIRVPRVIVLMLFDRLPKKEVKFTRHNVFERDNNTCQYCGKVFDRSDLNLDHVHPRDKGGLTTWENVVCSCIPCNTRKATACRTRRTCSSSANRSGRSGGRLCTSPSAASSTRAGGTSSTSPTGTWS